MKTTINHWIFVGCAVLAMSSSTQASGDKIIQETDVSQSVDVSNASDAFAANENINEGSLNRSDNLALGLSNALGGAAATGDCYASTQTSIVVVAWQDNELNHWCAGVWYDSKGMRAMAARARCQMKGVRKMFPKGEAGDAECRAENIVPYETLSTQDEIVSQLKPMLEEQQAIITEYEALTAALTARIENLEEEQAKEEKRRQAASRAVQQRLAEEEKARSEYAKEALARLDAYK